MVELSAWSLNVSCCQSVGVGVGGARGSGVSWFNSAFSFGSHQTKVLQLQNITANILLLKLQDVNTTVFAHLGCAVGSNNNEYLRSA